MSCDIEKVLRLEVLDICVGDGDHVLELDLGSSKGDRVRISGVVVGIISALQDLERCGCVAVVGHGVEVSRRSQDTSETYGDDYAPDDRKGRYVVGFEGPGCSDERHHRIAEKHDGWDLRSSNDERYQVMTAAEIQHAAGDFVARLHSWE